MKLIRVACSIKTGWGATPRFRAKSCVVFWVICTSARFHEVFSASPSFLRVRIRYGTVRGALCMSLRRLSASSHARARTHTRDDAASYCTGASSVGIRVRPYTGTRTRAYSLISIHENEHNLPARRAIGSLMMHGMACMLTPGLVCSHRVMQQ